MLSEEHFIPFRSSNLTGKRVLVLAPHPDDETFGCGGSLALHADAGDPIRVVFLTNGAKGDMSRRFERNTYIRMRQQEARSACACLGITDVIFFSYEDRELYKAETITSEIIDVIKEFRPGLIYAPSPQEFHPDHRAAAAFIQTVMKMCDTDAELLCYEINQPIQVNRLVDITPVLDRKIRAIREYQSQLEEGPFEDISLALSRFRSVTLPDGANHAEGFLLFNAEKADGINVLESKVTPWSGKLVANFMENDKAYTLAVIVRTQGVRPSLLTEALQSIACQGVPCLAVVVVHAGSEMLEPVMAVCRSIEGLSYVIIHADRTEKKRGYPLNLGLQYCLHPGYHFEAIAFLDDDDIFYPEFSQKLYQTLKDSGADVVYAATNRRVPGQPAEEGKRLIPVLNIFLWNFITINSYVILRESLIKAQVFFDESLDVVEDWHFLLQLMSKGFHFEAITDTLSEVRIISDGNKQVKDHPEIWDQAYHRIHAYVRDCMFLMNGRMLQRSLKEEEEQKAILNRDMEKKVNELINLNLEIETMRSAHVALLEEFRRERDDADKRIDSLQSEIENLKQELTEARRINNELLNLKSEIEAMRRVHAALLEEYHRESNVANKQIDSLQSEIENLRLDLTAARGTNKALSAEYSRTANEVIALRESKSWKITEPLRNAYGLILTVLSVLRKRLTTNEPVFSPAVNADRSFIKDKKICVLFINHISDTQVFNTSVAALSAFLKKNNNSVKTCMLNVRNSTAAEDILSDIKRISPDVIAFSIITTYWEHTSNLMSEIKKTVNALMVCGGCHTILCPDEVISHPCVDVICIGEGEHPLLELIRRLENNKSYEDIPGLWVKKHSAPGIKIVKNPLPGLENLDDLPYWDRDIFTESGLHIRQFSLTHHGGFPIASGRGCPYNCHFCNNSSFLKMYADKGHKGHRYVRKRSVNNVIEECEFLIKKYNVQFFEFWDEMFTTDSEWVKNFCEIYKEKISRPFGCAIRVEHADDTTLRCLYDAGCRLVLMGVEAGNENYRKTFLNRPMSNTAIEKAFAEAKAVGIERYAGVMLGFPDETPQMIEDTIDLLLRIKPDVIGWSWFYPLPGTYLYQYCKEKGYLTGESIFPYQEEPEYKIPLLKQPSLSTDDIIHFCAKFRKLEEQGFKVNK